MAELPRIVTTGLKPVLQQPWVQVAGRDVDEPAWVKYAPMWSYLSYEDFARVELEEIAFDVGTPAHRLDHEQGALEADEWLALCIEYPHCAPIEMQRAIAAGEKRLELTERAATNRAERAERAEYRRRIESLGVETKPSSIRSTAMRESWRRRREAEAAREIEEIVGLS